MFSLRWESPESKPVESKISNSYKCLVSNISLLFHTLGNCSNFSHFSCSVGKPTWSGLTGSTTAHNLFNSNHHGLPWPYFSFSCSPLFQGSTPLAPLQKGPWVFLITLFTIILAGSAFSSRSPRPFQHLHLYWPLNPHTFLYKCPVLGDLACLTSLRSVLNSPINW